MVFSSLLFIFIYLVVTLALYYAVPNLRLSKRNPLCSQPYFLRLGRTEFCAFDDILHSVQLALPVCLSENIETTKNAARLYSLLPLC